MASAREGATDGAGHREESEPEPDVAVVPGSFRDYVGGHPSRPALVLEVSESSLALDREHKGSALPEAEELDAHPRATRSPGVFLSRWQEK